MLREDAGFALLEGDYVRLETQANIWHNPTVPRVGDLFLPFWRQLTSFGKLLLGAVAMVAITIATYIAVFISDEIHAHGDPWLVSATEALVQSPEARGYLNNGLRVASQHPFGFFLIATFVVVALSAAVSAFQVWRAVGHGVVNLSENAAPTPATAISAPDPNIRSSLPTFNPIPIRDQELFARSDSPMLEDAGKWLRKIEQQWKECVVSLKAFAAQWNQYASDFPAIQFRIGMLKDAERDVARSRDAVAGELESLLELFGGPQDRHPKELWGPLRDYERKALYRGFQILGKHSINIACSGKTDCIKRAQEFAELFTQAGWTTKFLGSNAYGATGANAILVTGKEDDSLAHNLSNLLLAILGGTITSKLNMSVNSENDVLLVVGPKPPSDWH